LAKLLSSCGKRLEVNITGELSRDNIIYNLS